MTLFPDIFAKYPAVKAPFLHRQYAEWSVLQPLRGLRIVHHVPLVQNTLLKIACVVAGGAEVVVTNPTSFMRACPIALQQLEAANIRYVSDMQKLKSESFDIYLDCGAELYQTLGAPTLGAIELTGTGDQYYREHQPNFPVISIDRSLTKQLETVFGMAQSATEALQQLLGHELENKSWIIFGFGKIGRGLAYFCHQRQISVTVVDINDNEKQSARQLQLNYVDARDHAALQAAVNKAEIVVTATGRESVMSAYPKNWFSGKTLVNMGILDEFGAQFSADEVLNHKQPINFILSDPTPITYIDPELFAHNAVMLDLMNLRHAPSVHDMSEQLDQRIINEWCDFHHAQYTDIAKWFKERATMQTQEENSHVKAQDTSCLVELS